MHNSDHHMLHQSVPKLKTKYKYCEDTLSLDQMIIISVQK